jgi:hypothetical protein
MGTLKPLKIDIVSDVVCPWCYIGKRRIENALALVPDVPVEVHWRPFFLNPWVPREGIAAGLQPIGHGRSLACVPMNPKRTVPGVASSSRQNYRRD